MPCSSTSSTRGFNDQAAGLPTWPSSCARITHGMRARASELATEWLGPRTEREIEASLTREVTQERWTSLDAAIRQELTDGVIDVNTWTGDARLAERAAIIGRLNHLSTMGLAEKTQPGVWRVSADAPEILRAMGERGDIVRTLQRAIGGRHQAYQIFDPARASDVTGRIVSKGLHDELSDRGYVIVDGVDGRAHYAAVAIDADIASLPVGAIVELRGADTRSADRAIAATAQSGIYRSDDHLRELRMDPTLTREPDRSFKPTCGAWRPFDGAASSRGSVRAYGRSLRICPNRVVHTISNAWAAPQSMSAVICPSSNRPEPSARPGSISNWSRDRPNGQIANSGPTFGKRSRNEKISWSTQGLASRLDAQGRACAEPACKIARSGDHRGGSRHRGDDASPASANDRWR